MKLLAGAVKVKFWFCFFILCLLGTISFFTLNNCGGGGGGSSSGGTIPPITSGDYILADHLAAMVDVPVDAINAAKATLHIAYGHTSHGSQIISGMDALESWSSTLYAWNNGGTGGALDLRNDMGGYSSSYGAYDLNQPNRTAWIQATRDYLSAHPDINVIIWSWCSGADGTEEEIQQYLDSMNGLEAEYPQVKFVYMTGHLNGTGANGNLNIRNNQIRAYCLANNKILFDFADIESYDPDGNEFMTLNATENCDYSGGNWATEWIADNPGHILTTLTNTHCSYCSHSDSPTQAKLNCVLKGRAIWWLWARLAGWNP